MSGKLVKILSEAADMSEIGLYKEIQALKDALEKNYPFKYCNKPNKADE